MTINDRIKEFRKTKGITLEQLGSKIGLGKSTLSMIEANKSSVTERTIHLICDKYSVSEQWLREGIGEMYVPTARRDAIKRMFNTLEDGSFKERLVAALAELEVDDWKKIESFALKIMEEEGNRPELLAAHLREEFSIDSPEAQADIEMAKALEEERRKNDKV